MLNQWRTSVPSLFLPLSYSDSWHFKPKFSHPAHLCASIKIQSNKKHPIWQGMTPIQKLRLALADTTTADGLTSAQRAALLSSMSSAQRIKFQTRFPSLYDLAAPQLSSNAYLNMAQRAALVGSMSEGHKGQFKTHFPVWAGLKAAKMQQQQQQQLQQRAALVDQLGPRSIAARAAFQDAIVNSVVN